MNRRSDKKCVSTLYQKILKKCWPAKEVKNVWVFNATKYRPKKVAKNAWVFHTKKYFTIVVLVKNAWVFCTRKYWAEIDVRNAYVFSVSKNIGRKWYKMREYFLPTIRLTTWTCLIVGWKCWPFCTRTIIGRKQGYKMREYVLPENSERKFGWKSVSILYQFFRTTSSGIKKVAQKAQKNCFPLLRSGVHQLPKQWPTTLNQPFILKFYSYARKESENSQHNRSLTSHILYHMDFIFCITYS